MSARQDSVSIDATLTLHLSIHLQLAMTFEIRQRPSQVPVCKDNVRGRNTHLYTGAYRKEPCSGPQTCIIVAGYECDESFRDDRMWMKGDDT